MADPFDSFTPKDTQQADPFDPSLWSDQGDGYQALPTSDQDPFAPNKWFPQQPEEPEQPESAGEEQPGVLSALPRRLGAGAVSGAVDINKLLGGLAKPALIGLEIVEPGMKTAFDKLSEIPEAQEAVRAAKDIIKQKTVTQPEENVQRTREETKPRNAAEDILYQTAESIGGLLPTMVAFDIPVGSAIKTGLKATGYLSDASAQILSRLPDFAIGMGVRAGVEQAEKEPTAMGMVKAIGKAGEATALGTLYGKIAEGGKLMAIPKLGAAGAGEAAYQAAKQGRLPTAKELESGFANGAAFGVMFGILPLMRRIAAVPAEKKALGELIPGVNDAIRNGDNKAFGRVVDKFFKNRLVRPEVKQAVSEALKVTSKSLDPEASKQAAVNMANAFKEGTLTKNDLNYIKNTFSYNPILTTAVDNLLAGEEPTPDNIFRPRIPEKAGEGVTQEDIDAANSMVDKISRDYNAGKIDDQALEAIKQNIPPDHPLAPAVQAELDRIAEARKRAQKKEREPIDLVEQVAPPPLKSAQESAQAFEDAHARDLYVRQSLAGLTALHGQLKERQEKANQEAMGGLVPYVKDLLSQVKMGEPGGRLRFQYPGGEEEWKGYSSTYPDLIGENGFGRDETIKAIEKGLSGHEWGPRETRQKEIWDTVLEAAKEQRKPDIVYTAEQIEQAPSTIEGMSDADYRTLIEELQNEGYSTRDIEEAAASYRKPIEASVIKSIAADTGFSAKEIRAILADESEPAADLNEAWQGAIATYPPPATEEMVNADEEERRLARLRGERETHGGAVPVEEGGAGAPGPGGMVQGASEEQPEGTQPVAPGTPPPEVKAEEEAVAPELEEAAGEEPEHIQKAAEEAEPEPSEAQIEAGNYKKGHIRIHGVDISVENPAGGVRRSKPGAAKQWEQTLTAHYGYIRGTQGNDGDQVDVFINPEPEKPIAKLPVFIENQVDPGTRKFDEHKVLLGYGTERAARSGYMSNYEKGWKGYGPMARMDWTQFEGWLAEGDFDRPVEWHGYHGPERRTNIKKRKLVSEMTSKEMRKELLTDPLTELPNRRAWDEAEKLPFQSSIDVDSLKWVNDNIGHDMGDELLKLVAKSLKQTELEPSAVFHISGDEFRMQSDEEEALHRAAGDATFYLMEHPLDLTLPGGKTVHLTGAFSYGTGTSGRLAEEALQRAKAKRQISGKRAGRGEKPPGLVAGPTPGNKGAPQGKAGGTKELPGEGVAQLVVKNKEGAVFGSPGYKGTTYAHLLKANQLKKEDVVDYGYLPAGKSKHVWGINPEGAAVHGEWYEQEILPPKQQLANPAKRIAKLLIAHGLEKKALEGEDFYMKLRNKGYLDLVIERHPLPDTPHIQGLYFTHYIEEGGDLIQDGEMVFAVQNGRLILSETAVRGPRGELRGRDAQFANVFSRNLIAQGFLKAKVVNPRAETKQPKPETTTPRTVTYSVKKDMEAENRKIFEKLPYIGKLISRKELPGNWVELKYEKIGEEEEKPPADIGMPEEQPSPEQKKPTYKIGDLVTSTKDSGITYTNVKVLHIRTHPDGRQYLRVEGSGNLHFAASDFKPAKPSEELEVLGPADIGTPDDLNVPALAQHFLGMVQPASRNKLNKVKIQMEVAHLLGTTRAKLVKDPEFRYRKVQEAFEAAIVLKAREVVGYGHDFTTTYNMLKDIYEWQPNLSTRTSGSVQLQEYSTPIHLGYLMQRAIEVIRTDQVYEPTAGNGALVTIANPDLVAANELDPTRRTILREQGFTVTGVDAAHTVPKYASQSDKVLANPPFGVEHWEKIKGYDIKMLEHKIIMRSISAMKNNGKAAFIIGNTNFNKAGKLRDADRIFLNWLNRNYNVVRNIDIPGEEYARQGTKFPIRLIILDGRRAPNEIHDVYASTDPSDRAAYQAVKSVDELVPELRRIWNGEPTGLAAADGSMEVQEPTAPPRHPSEPQPTPGTKPAGIPPKVEGQGGGPRRPGMGGAGAAGGNLPSGGELAGNKPRPTTEHGAAPGGGGPSGPGKPPGERGAIPAPGPSGGRPGPEGVQGGGRPGERGAGQPEQGGGREPGKRPEPTGISNLDEVKLEDATPGQLLDAFDEAIKEQKPKTQPPPAEKRPAESAKQHAKETAEYLKQLAEGAKKINDLLGEEGEILPPADVDVDKYAKIKDILKQMWQAALAAGRSIKEFVKDVAALVGEKGRKYFAHWLQADFPALQKEAKPTQEDTATEYQVTYHPKSKGPIIDETLTPRTMRDAIEEALDSLEADVGGIDEYVARQLQYPNNQALFAAFSADQVDGIALAIRNLEKNGTATIIGDQTGVGKGRIAAALYHWARLQGGHPVFFTEKANLFTDFYRDITDIGRKFLPYIMASDKDRATIVDPRTRLPVFRPLIGEKRTNMLRKLREMGVGGMSGYDGILTTYSQINKEGNLPQQALANVIPGNFVILDESHNASGPESNTGIFLREMLTHARGVIYLSATYAKRPDTVPIYFRTDLSKANVTMDELIDAVTKGDTPLQEITSTYLARLGQLLRREKSFEGIKNEWEFDTKNRARDEKRADQMTTHIRDILHFDSELMAGIEDATKKPKGTAAKNWSPPSTVYGVPIPGSEVQGGKRIHTTVSASNFAATVHNAVRSLLLCMKVRTAADRAIEELKSGRKPVIALANTMESFLKQEFEEGAIRIGDPIGNITYADVLRRYLSRCLRVSIKGPSDKEATVHTIAVNDLPPRLQTIYRQIDKSISETMTDIPGSPIDYLLGRLRDAGYKAAEITGRQFVADLEKPDMPLRRRTGPEISDRNAIIRGYNDGDLDALIINRAASAGLSLHTAPTALDKRPRTYQGVQAELNIDSEVQKQGRVNRKGQVNLPFYRFLMLDLPAEIRPAAVHMRKMRSLSANVSANSDSPLAQKTFPDLLNKYGDEVVENWLHDHPQEAADMNLLSDVRTGLAMKATGKIAIQPVAMQRRFFDEVERAYNEYIKRLKEEGTYDLQVDDLDFKARVLSTSILTVGKDETNPFGKSTRLEELRVASEKKPYNKVRLTRMLDRTAEAHDGSLHRYKSNILREIRAAHAEYLEENEGTLKLRYKDPDAIKRALNAIKIAMQSLEYRLSDYDVGDTYEIRLSSDMAMNGVLIAIDAPRPGRKFPGNPAAPSNTTLIFAVDNALQRYPVPLSKILDGDINVQWMSTGIFPAWDEMAGQDIRLKRHMITGNLIQGYADAPVGSRIVRFSMEDGSTREGILLPLSYKSQPSSHRTVRVTKEIVHDLLSNHAVDRLESRRVIIQWRPSDRLYRLQVPRSKAAGSIFFLDDTLRALTVTGDFETSGKYMVAHVPQPNTQAMIDRLYDLGEGFSVPYAVYEASGHANGPTTTSMRPAPPGPSKEIIPQVWPESFPRIVGHTTIAKLKAHPDYNAAKGGDIDAAVRLVKDLVKPERLQALKKRHPNAKLLPIIAVEKTGVNKIPLAYAAVIHAATGMESETGIVQTNRVFHTAASALTRLARPAIFDGPVEPGREYIAVDDVATSGATLRELRNYIEANGGKFVEASTLALAQFSSRLHPSEETISKINANLGEKNVEAALRQAGITGGLRSLTQSQLREISRYGSIDALRNRLLEERGRSGLQTRARPARQVTQLTPHDIQDAQRALSEALGILRTVMPEDVQPFITVNVKPRMTLADLSRDPKQIERSLREHGGNITGVAGATTMNNVFALMQLSQAQTPEEFVSTTYHEAFHIAARWLLPDKDYQALMDFFEGNEEEAATGFSYFARTNSANVLKGKPGLIRRFFIQLNRIIRALKAKLGDRIARVQQIYDRILRQKYQPLEQNERLSHVSQLMAQERENAPVFYSKLTKVVEAYEDMPRKTASLLKWLEKKQVKPAELKWLNVEQWVKDNAVDGKIDRDAFREYLRVNQIQLTEVIRSGNDAWEEDEVELESTEPVYDEEQLEEAGGDPETVDELVYATAYLGENPSNNYTIIGNDWSGQWATFTGDDTRAENYVGAEGSLGDALSLAKEHYYRVFLEAPERRENRATKYSQYSLIPGPDAHGYGYKEILITLPTSTSAISLGPGGKHDYYGSHWNEPNVLAHARVFDNIVTKDGDTAFYVDEVQSDWLQDAKKRGFRDELPGDMTFERINDGFRAVYKNVPSHSVGGIWPTREEVIANLPIQKGVPRAPFLENWPMVVMKRMLRHAVEQGKDYLAWSTGKIQNERYNLAKYVGGIDYARSPATTVRTSERLYSVRVFDKLGHVMKDLTFNDMTAKNLADTFGKQIAAKIVKGSGVVGDWRSLQDLDLEVGGEGMKEFYDRKLVAEMGKYVKQWGGKMKELQLRTFLPPTAYNTETGGASRLHTVNAIRITPDMREDVLYTGQTMFRPEPPEKDDLQKWAKDYIGDTFKRAGQPKATAADREKAQKLKDEQRYMRENWNKNIADSAKRIIKQYPKIAKTGWASERPDTTFLQRLLQSPEFYFEEVPAAQRVLEARLEKPEAFRHHLADITESDRLLEDIKGHKKARPEEYDKLRALIKRADQYKKNYQAADLKEMGFSDDAITAWSAYRQIMNHGFDKLYAQMLDIIQSYEAAGLEVPAVVTWVDGKKVRINLKVALATMGDMRGYYAPRQRKPGKWMVVGKKKGAHPKMEFRDTRTAANILHAQWAREGYIVRKSKTKNMPEDVFEMAGQTVALGAMVNAAFERVSSQKSESTLADFGLSGKLVETDAGPDFQLRGPYTKRMTEVFKAMGGKWYRADQAWHFTNPPGGFEQKVANALANMLRGIGPYDTEPLFAYSIAMELANVVKGRGFRSRMIKRKEGIGLDVWEGYEEDPLKAAAQYAAGISAGLAKKEMASKMVKAVTGTDIEPSDYDSYEGYLAAVEARRIDPAAQRNIWRDVKVYMEETLRNQEFSDRVIAAVKAAAVLKYLGFRLASPLVNLTALATSVPAALNEYAGVPWGKVPGFISSGMADFMTYRFGDRSRLSPETVAMFDNFELKGWTEAQFRQEALAVLSSRIGLATSAILRASMFMFGATEKLNRAATLSAAYKGARDQGSDVAEAFEKAKLTSNRAHGIYMGNAALPHYAQGQNIFAKVMKSFYTFSKFTHTYLQTMYDIGWKRKNTKGLLYMWLAGGMIAGAGAIVGWSVFMALAKKILGVDDPEEAIYTWLANTFGPWAEYLGRFGLSGMTGIGVSLKGSLKIDFVGNMPNTIPELLGAPGSIYTDIVRSGQSASRGQWGRAAEYFLPRAAAAPIQALREYRHGVTSTGNVPKLLDGRIIQPTPLDTVLRALTFNPAHIAAMKERKWAETRLKEAYRQRRADIYARLRGFYAISPNRRSQAEYESILLAEKEYNDRIRAGKLYDKGVSFITPRSIESALKLRR